MCDECKNVTSPACSSRIQPTSRKYHQFKPINNFIYTYFLITHAALSTKNNFVQKLEVQRDTLVTDFTEIP